MSDDVKFVHMQELVDERFKAIEDDLHEIKGTIDFIRDTVVKADTAITTIAAEVKPTLDSLMEHPMLKMFFGGKK